MRQRLIKAQPWLSTLARLFLAGVFLLSGWPKLMDIEGTVRSVRAFRLLPEIVVRPFAYGLPMVELSVAVLLIIGIGTRLLALITAAMMVMFLFGVASAWARGLSLDCGCFGNTGGTVVTNAVPGYIKDLFRDTGFLLIALGLAWRPYSRYAADNPLGLTPQPDPVLVLPPSATGKFAPRNKPNTAKNPKVSTGVPVKQNSKKGRQARPAQTGKTHQEQNRQNQLAARKNQSQGRSAPSNRSNGARGRSGR